MNQTSKKAATTSDNELPHMLNGDEVGANEGYMIDLLEHANNAAVVDTGNQHREQVREKGWLFLKVERQTLVVAVAQGQYYSGSY